GVGTRKINLAGKQAIRDVYTKTQGNESNTFFDPQLADKVVTFKQWDGDFQINLRDIRVEALQQEPDGSMKFEIVASGKSLGDIWIYLNPSSRTASIELSNIHGAKISKNYWLTDIINGLAKKLGFKDEIVSLGKVNQNAGKGIGKAAYIDLARKLKVGYDLNLVSDDIRSQEAENMWNSLEKKGYARKIPN